MKAAQIQEYGDPSVVKIVEVDTPAVEPGKVLVEVYASSLNPFDTTVRTGRSQIPFKFPFTLGGDIAGTILEIGKDVEGFAVGDKVYGQAAVVAGNSGAFAEYAVTKASQSAKMPQNVDFNEAASLPLVGVSAWQAVVQHIGLKAGQKIFIHGGAGGIGRNALQIAKHIGASVATTATGPDMEDVKALGADKVVDYKKEDFADVLSDYDAVFDTVGGDDFTKALSILKPDGVAVTMIADFDENKANELGVTAIRQSTRVTTEALNALRDLVESGTIKPYVAKVFSLEDTEAAFEFRESGKVSGKVVLEIRKI